MYVEVELNLLCRVRNVHLEAGRRLEALELVRQRERRYETNVIIGKEEERKGANGSGSGCPQHSDSSNVSGVQSVRGRSERAQGL
jgi:hypothetical protein